jgi:hypothetical protein
VSAARQIAPMVASEPEPVITPQEAAARLKVSVSTALRMFQDRPGILKFGKAGRRDGKRDYVTIRIPESVFAQVYRELSR